ncbi:MAG: peptidoglycan editing factor PgeF [Thalassotalea sp.]|nr:peptidoglycan editing factor PgeF [Thalassotalea sp.]
MTIDKPRQTSYLQLIDWPADNVVAFTTSRGNGAYQTTDTVAESPASETASSTPYSAFNLGLHVGDEQQGVLANRFALTEHLPQNSQIQWLEQVHGNNVADVIKVSQEAIVADAAITDSSNTALAVMTADCLPILLSSTCGKIVAAIHGGWRPLAANVIERTVAVMAKKFTQSGSEDELTLVAWLGPCIGPNAFEVGDEVRQTFIAEDSVHQSAFTAAERGDKWLCDLHQIASRQLSQFNVQQILSLPDCTFSSPDKYYSYRRDKLTGRMASVICAKSII